MTTTQNSRSHRTPARTALVAGLVTAAIGVFVLFAVGVPGFPPIPPGPIILLVAAIVVAVVRWRWTPILGLGAALFLTVGAVLAGAPQAMLATPSDPGPFVGSVIQVIGLGVALVAGAVAVVQASSQ